MKPLLEDRLAEQLLRLAEGSPPMAVELSKIDGRVHHRKRRRTQLRMAGGVGLIAVVGAGMFAIGTRRTEDPRSLEAAAETQTQRIESPLVNDPTVLMYSPAVKPGALAFELADGQQLTFAIVGAPHFDGYRQYSCVAMDSETTCRVQPSDLDVSITSEDELGGDSHVAYWTHVPESTDIVEFFADGKISWQRPIGGIAAFPVASHRPDDTLVALDAAGNELARVSWSRTRSDGSSSTDDSGTQTNYFYTSLDSPTIPDVDVSMIQNLTQAEEDAYRSFADDTMLACLEQDGADAWSACIQSTDAAVKNFLRSLQDGLPDASAVGD
jgi:hypothetical protein